MPLKPGETMFGEDTIAVPKALSHHTAAPLASLESEESPLGADEDQSGRDLGQYEAQELLLVKEIRDEFAGTIKKRPVCRRYVEIAAWAAADAHRAEKRLSLLAKKVKRSRDDREDYKLLRREIEHLWKMHDNALASIGASPKDAQLSQDRDMCLADIAVAYSKAIKERRSRNIAIGDVSPEAHQLAQAKGMDVKRYTDLVAPVTEAARQEVLAAIKEEHSDEPDL